MLTTMPEMRLTRSYRPPCRFEEPLLCPFLVASASDARNVPAAVRPAPPTAAF